MYHHRYQPQTSHLANKNNNSLASNNHFRNSSTSNAQSSNYQANYTSTPSQAAAASAPTAGGPLVDSIHHTSSTAPPPPTSASGNYQQNNNNNSFVGNNRFGATNSAYHSGAYFSQPKQFAEERQDVIFRRVRGILNKITPETFDKLSKELINVGLDSPRTLRGLIYLLFDKALKDLKYSSLYAKLCQELSERSPNFEKEPGPNTFCKFLISKCEDEFERRRKATEDFERKNELTDEEFEQKVIAKQKMLGNIKFICELGKKRLLQEEILHECIRGLLSKKKERPLQDQAQDLECLCQIMRTIGSLLDIEASRNLMNQYFERIDMYSRKPELPSRIRFMLRDVIDLRNNNWRPRPYQREDNVPQPLSKLREEAGFNSAAASNKSIDKLGNTKNHMNINDITKLHGGKLSTLLIDDDEPGFTTTTDFQWGPTFLPHENEFDIFSPGIYDGVTHKVDPIRTTTPTVTVSSNKPNHPNHHPPHNQHQGLTLGTGGTGASRFSQASRFEQHVGRVKNHLLDNAPPSGQRVHNSRSQGSEHLGQNENIGRRNEHNIDDKQRTDRGYESAKFPMRENLPTSQPQYQPAANNQNMMKPNDIPQQPAAIRQSDRNDFPRGNKLTTRNNGPPTLGHQRQLNMSGADIMQPPQFARRPPYGDMSRPLPPNRNNDVLPQPRNVPPLKQPTPVDMQSPPRPVPQHETTQSNARSHVESTEFPHQTHHDRNFVPTPNGHMGPRRFERGRDGRPHEHEPRQPKFSAANYRLPGRDRPNPPPFKNQQNRQPESEVNLNWRSAQAATEVTVETVKEQKSLTKEPEPPRPARIQVLNTSTQKPLDVPMNQVNNVFVDSRQEPAIRQDVLGTSTQANINSSIKFRDVGFDFRDKNDTPPTARLHPLPPTELQNEAIFNNNELWRADVRSPSPDMLRPNQPRMKQFANKNNSSTRFNNERPIDQFRNETNLNQSRPRRSDEIEIAQSSVDRPGANQSKGNHGARNLQSDRPGFNEKREIRDRDHHRRFSPPAGLRQDDDMKQPPRPHEIQFDRRSYRPAVGRNQSFESDFRKGPNWRNENLNQGRNDQGPKKDNSSVVPPPVSTPVLPKPPTRMSETDFTLRPSHNLIGRTVTESNSKLNENTPIVNSKENATISQKPEINSAVRPQLFNEVQGSVQEQRNSDSRDSDKAEKETNEEMFENVARARSLSKFMSIFTEHLTQALSEAAKLASRVKDLKLPKAHHEECLVGAMKHSILRSELDRENTSKIFAHLVPSTFESCTLLSAFKAIFDQMKALEVETPKVKSLVASFLSRAVYDGLLAIEDVAQVLNGGKHHPLFLLFLQKLEKSAGQAWLSEKFIASKVNLMDMLPEVDRTKDRLASSLKDRCLGFLDPMLTIEPDLWEQMRDRDPSPNTVYRWIKDNVDQTIQGTPTFAQVFISCLLKYIHSTTIARNNNNTTKDPESSDSSKSSPTNSSSHGINDQEKELLVKYQQVMHAILKDKQMQLATLYALQSFYFGLDFPKGALLRWFHMLYDLSIVDDDVFFIWKEEINDKVPGKGQALFQVNTWLNWLAEAESEEEEDV